MRDGVRREGSVVALGPDTLRAIWPGTTETALRVADIQKLEYMSGRRRTVRRSLLIGTVGGVVLGTAAAAISYKPCESTEFLGCSFAPESRSEQAAAGALLGGVTGLVIGGVVGLIPRDRWERVRLDGHVVHLRPRTLPDGSRGLGLAVAF